MTAGTLFLGEFSINLSNTLKSTKFGIPFVKEAFPKSLEVEWSYQAGAKYYATNGAKDANGKFQPVENDDDNKTLMVLKPDAPADEGSVAAVIYEVSDYTNDYLDGTNLQTATDICSYRLPQKTTNTTMTTESVNFKRLSRSTLRKSINWLLYSLPVLKAIISRAERIRSFP